MRLSPVKIGFFLFGLAAFIVLVSRFGLDQILANMVRAGWSLLYIVGLWFIIYLLNACAWRLVLGDAAKQISFLQLFMVTVSGFVINYVTPVIALGGEPYKINSLSGYLGNERAVSAVVLYRMVHLLGHMLLLLFGIGAAVAALSLPAAVVWPLLAAGAAIAVLIGLTVVGHRDGIFERLLHIGTRLPFLRRSMARLESYRGTVREMDEALTEVYRHRRGQFYAAVGLEFLSRVCMGIEVYLILRGVGVEVGPVMALFLYVFYSIVINLLFFIPLNLGAREGGLALGLQSLMLAPLLGVYLGVVMRIREFVWIMVGLLFILLTGSGRRRQRAVIES